MGVRKLARELYGNREEQMRHVQQCLTVAGTLTASAKAAGDQAVSGASIASSSLPSSPTTNSTGSNLVCFAEVADTSSGEGVAAANVTTHAALSGVTVAVADCVDVTGFSTRFGLGSSMHHHVARPDSELPFVSWLRMHGAHVVGKLSCHSPLCLEESTVINPGNSAAVAVTSGACDIALTSSILGPAGLTSCLLHDVCVFKPTARSFARPRGLASPFWTDSQSVALVGRHFDDLLYLWHVHTGEFNASMIRSQQQQKNQAAIVANGDPSQTHVSLEKKDQSPAGSRAGAAPNSGRDDSSLGITGHSQEDSYQQWTLRRWLRDRIATRTKTKKQQQRTRNDDTMIDLTVGYPAKWIDKLMGQRMTSNSFAYQLHQMREKHRSLFKGSQESTRLRIRPIEFDSIDLDQVFKNVNAIASYELANAFDANVDKYVLGHSSSPLEGFVMQAAAGAIADAGSIPSSSRAASAFLDELPQPVVTAIFEGRRLTSWDYSRALQGRERIVSYVEELFRDVDVICSPIVSEPFADGNTRSILMTLPFSMVGSPTASAYLSDELSVQLVGELGRDSGLVDDATAFLSFVKGSSPGWFRRKFLNEK